MTMILLLVIHSASLTISGDLQFADRQFADVDSLTLERAYLEAEKAAPARSNLEIQRLTARLNRQNIATAYLPSLSVVGHAVYNSEVAEIPISIPGQEPPSVSNDQYKLGLSLEQLIFDGGSVGKLKKLEEATLGFENQSVAVSLYSIRQHVERSYFGALIARARQESLEVRRADLQSKLDEVRALIDEGVLTMTSADQISVELLSLEQQYNDIRIEYETALNILGEWMGRELPAGVVLLLPEPTESVDTNPTRPEFVQFDLARAVLDSQDAIQSLATRPRLSSFGEVAYGRAPGLNLFENNFQPYFSVGVRLKWSAWDWKKTSRTREITQLKKRSIDVQTSQFQQHLNIALAQKKNDVDRLRSALRTDNEVIALRQRIRIDAENRLESGIATATDYIREVNAEQLAVLSKRLHQIELSKAMVEYQTIRGAK